MTHEYAETFEFRVSFGETTLVSSCSSTENVDLMVTTTFFIIILCRNLLTLHNLNTLKKSILRRSSFKFSFSLKRITYLNMFRSVSSFYNSKKAFQGFSFDLNRANACVSTRKTRDFVEYM